MSRRGSVPRAPTKVGSAIASPTLGVSILHPLLRRVRLAAQEQVAFLLMILLLVAGTFLSKVFLTPRNLLNILWSVSVLGIVALGQTLLLITCNFDLSVSMVVAFAGIVTVGLQIAGWALWTSILGGLLAGALVGVLNGVIVVLTKANPLLITLGTQTLVYSMSLILTGAKTWYATIPAFNVLGRGQMFGFLPYSVVIFLVMVIILEFTLHFTAYGRYLYVLGLNEEAGRLSGVLVRRVKVATFIFCGLTAALAGLIMTSRLNSTSASSATGMDFDSIIVTVLGGTSLFGGSGGTLRTLVGVMVFGILTNVLVLVGVPYEGQWIAKGVVFLMVVASDSYFRRR